MGRPRKPVSIRPVSRSMSRRLSSVAVSRFGSQKSDSAMGKRAAPAQSLVRVAVGAGILSFQRINDRSHVVLDHSLVASAIPSSQAVGVEGTTIFGAAFTGNFDAHFRI